MSDSLFSNVTFVLVRPEFLGNIGSVARVMKNFGFADLRLVTPPKNYKDAEARMMAVGAFDILKSAPVFDTLPSALADVNLAISTSSGRRRSRPLDNLASCADEFVELGTKNRLAVVFGNERNGLTDEEVSLCNRKIRIETSENFAALNLAQAAGIIAYQLAHRAGAHARQPTEKQRVAELPESKQMQEIFEQLDLLLGKVEFSRTHNKRLILTELKDAIDRMNPNRREASILRGALFKLNEKLELTSV
ncbi:MAG: TrmJ/YjtD family RNA methyltransferase [Candidatus Obscuribacterales bacterium]|nr:TrmJ/YjtD family RNA methyltransferase [Candidatus Obscuribacterales bacterium]